jgi:RNA polymerase sigma factor (sigma-70 family)
VSAVPLVSDRDVAAIYVDHHSWLVSWLRRKLGGADQASDLAQDTFVRILTVQETRRELTLQEPRAYLTTIAHRLLINHVKRVSLEQAYLDVLAQMPEPETMSTETRMLILETLHEIDAMLDGLGDKVREAFLLSQLEGLTYAEIATRLGVTDRTVKRYMAAAFEQCILLVTTE